MSVIGSHFTNILTYPPVRDNPLTQRPRSTPAPRTLPRDFVALNPIARFPDAAQPAQVKPRGILPAPKVRQPIALEPNDIPRLIAKSPIARYASTLEDPALGGSVTNYIPVDKYI